MAKRRSNKEGSIYKRPDGSWRAQVSVGGRRLSYSAKTQRECQAWIKETVQKVDAGHSFKGDEKPLAEFLSGWLVSIKSSRQSTTWNLYERIIRDHIVPVLGEIRLGNLRPEQVQSLYDRKIEKGVGLRTVQQTHEVLRCALKQAVKLGMLGRNPVDAATPPKRTHKEMRFYDDAQAQGLMIAAMATEDRHLALYQLAITTGMRQGELLGLKWNDLDWERRSLQVHRQLRKVVGGGYELAAPKTRAGKRTITLGEATVEKLREHLQRQYQERQVAGDRWKDWELIFPSTIGTPMDSVALRKSFKSLIKQAGLLEIRFHDLRHTAASLMLNYGVPVIVVSRRLGHSKPSITLDVYGHLIPGMQEKAATIMDEILTPLEMSGCTIIAPEMNEVLSR